jgi:hypothetical protein
MENKEANRQAVRMLVRAREDFQAMRKRMDNRIGRKADGSSQDIEERMFTPDDVTNFQAIADEARAQERKIERMLEKVLRRFPVYTEFLSKTQGVGPISAGWIIGEYDIEVATTVSKLWQFTGLNPGMVHGKKRKERKDGSFEYVMTDKMIPGDKLTAGFVAPFNKRLRTAMVGVLADGFIKAGLRWEVITEDEYEALPDYLKARKDKKIDGEKVKNAPCRLAVSSKYVQFYLDYKNRLENSERMTVQSRGSKSPKDVTWSESSKGHRDRAAKRYMIKMFLKDLYAAWRELDGLPVREPYQVEYLEHVHA